MSNEIILYDIDSSLSQRAWSPNVWKTRYSLNYKGIPYRTEWLEYPDIEATCKRIGAEPTEQRSDGSWMYTLPVIYDPSTKRAVADSAKIAEYLDEQYPDTPRLFPPGNRALQAAYLSAYRVALPALWPFAFPATGKILREPNAEYWDRTKYGDDIPRRLSDEERRTEWKRLHQDFGRVDVWFHNNGEDRQFVLGDTISFCDLALAGYIIWLRIVWGEQSEEWEEFTKWHNGRWGKLLEGLRPYEQIV